jgi:hypothetical protein
MDDLTISNNSKLQNLTLRTAFHDMKKRQCGRCWRLTVASLAPEGTHVFAQADLKRILAILAQADDGRGQVCNPARIEIP